MTKEHNAIISLLKERGFVETDIQRQREIPNAFKVNPSESMAPIYCVPEGNDELETRIRIWNENEAEAVFVVRNNKDHRFYDAKEPPFNSKQAEKKLFFPTRDTLVSGRFYAENAINFEHKKRKSVDTHLVESLESLLKKLADCDLSYEYAHGLIDRCLFASFLDHRNLWKPKLLLSDALDKRNIPSINSIFDELAEQFNGELSRAPRCFLTHDIIGALADVFASMPFDGNQQRLFPYRFDLINTDMISSIFERFIEATALWSNNVSGTHYTPRQIALRVVEKTLEPLLLDKNESELHEITILDPCCGSGIFLVQAFLTLKKSINNQRELSGRSPLSAQESVELMVHTITGWDIEPTAIRIAAFSLTLAILDGVEQIPTNFKFPYLINNMLFIRDGLLNGVVEKKGNIPLLTPPESSYIEQKKFDVVIGNPPWGFKSFSQSYKKILKAKYPQPNKGSSSEAFAFKFLELTKATGRVGVLLNSTVWTNRTSQFRVALDTTGRLESVIDFSCVHDILGYSSSSEHTTALFFGKYREDRAISLLIPTHTPFSRMMKFVMIHDSNYRLLDLHELNKLEKQYGLNPLAIMHASSDERRLIKRIFDDNLQTEIDAQKGGQVRYGANIDLPFKAKYIGLCTHTKNSYSQIQKNDLRRTAEKSQSFRLLLRRHEVKGRLHVAVKSGNFTILDDVIALSSVSYDDYALASIFSSKFAFFVIKFIARQFGQRSHSYLDDTAVRLFPLVRPNSQMVNELLKLLSNLGRQLSNVQNEGENLITSEVVLDSLLEEIDQVVYELYGLSYWDIESVESFFERSIAIPSTAIPKNRYQEIIADVTSTDTTNWSWNPVLAGLVMGISNNLKPQLLPDHAIPSLLAGEPYFAWDSNYQNVTIYKSNISHAWSSASALIDGDQVNLKWLARDLRESA